MKNYTLPKEFTEKWLTALRSGEYKQIQNTLCKDGGYCCLGIAGLTCGLQDSLMSKHDDLFYDAIPKDNLPKELFLGMAETGRQDLQSVLAGLNDDDKENVELV